MVTKFLIYVVLFVWECFTGNKEAKPGKTTKKPPPNDDDDEARQREGVLGKLRAVAANFNRSKRFAAAVILLLAFSTVANYHLLTKVSALVREESEKTPPRKTDGAPTKNSDADQVYYQHLVEHLQITYAE